MVIAFHTNVQIDNQAMIYQFFTQIWAGKVIIYQNTVGI